MLVRDDESGRWVSLHHPFTAPKPFDADALRAGPGATLSQGYDIVLNGVEVGGGSVRIHRPDVQQAVFDLLGIRSEEHTSELQSLMRISYAVFCLKKKNKQQHTIII